MKNEGGRGGSQRWKGLCPEKARSPTIWRHFQGLGLFLGRRKSMVNFEQHSNIALGVKRTPLTAVWEVDTTEPRITKWDGCIIPRGRYCSWTGMSAVEVSRKIKNMELTRFIDTFNMVFEREASRSSQMVTGWGENEDIRWVRPNDKAAESLNCSISGVEGFQESTE